MNLDLRHSEVISHISKRNETCKCLLQLTLKLIYKTYIFHKVKMDDQTWRQAVQTEQVEENRRTAMKSIFFVDPQTIKNLNQDYDQNNNQLTLFFFFFFLFWYIF